MFASPLQLVQVYFSVIVPLLLQLEQELYAFLISPEPLHVTQSSTSPPTHPSPPQFEQFDFSP